LHFLTGICTKSFVGWDFAPDPIGGTYSAPPDPFRGHTSRAEGRGEERRRKKEEGRKGEKRGAERRRGCLSFA